MQTKKDVFAHTSKSRRHRHVLMVPVCLLLAAGPVAADEEFDIWLQALRAEAVAQGISQATLDSALAEIKPVERVVELDRKQPEFTQTFLDYLGKRANPERIARGRQLLLEHHELLEKAYHKYGVPPRYLVAFWGMETNFGDHLGGFSVTSALATLAYDERRSHFFRTELLNALRIIDRGHISAAEMKGSWAGAMGQLQFLPSVFLKYAVDADGDNRNDVWRTLPDVFYSGAHYLQGIGWQMGELWGREVRLPENFDGRLAGLDIRKTAAEWAQLGVTCADGRPFAQTEMPGSIILPQGYQGPAFLVYDNFRVIMRWNRSINYALAVGYLADQLIELPPLQNIHQADNIALSREQIAAVQNSLRELKFYSTEADGIVGPSTRKAIRLYQETAGLPVDGYASLSLLEHLQSAINPAPRSLQ